MTSIVRSQSHPRFLKRWLSRLTLVAFGILLALAIAEGALRLITPRSKADLFEYSTATPRYKLMKAGYEGLVYGVPIRTNRLGFRDSALEIPPKSEGEFRIIVLGDSFIVSAGVPYAEIATSKLQAALQAGTKRPVRVINLAVAGYSLIEYEAVLREVGLALKPDAVVIANYVPNDFELKTWIANREIAYGRKAKPVEHFPETLYLYKAFGPQLHAACAAVLSRLEPPKLPGRPSFGEGSEGWKENTQAFCQIAALTQAAGITLRVVLLPHPSNFNAQEKNHRTVQEFLSANGIVWADTLPAFRETRKPPQLFRINLIDSHPNAFYNAIVASVMAEEMLKFIPSGDQPVER